MAEKLLLADDVLNSAGIFGGYLGVDPQRDQKIGNQGMALINLVGDGLSCGEQKMEPSGLTVIYPFSRRFFMATLTLGLENPSSLAMSMERTVPF